jgi:hypothetical protein
MLDREIQKLESECNECDEADLPDLQELMLDYTRAANDLKLAYLATYTPNSNLPKYETLVKSQ